MGSSNHLKRLAMPRSWPLPRKTSIWVTRPTPGSHSLELCMPISLVIRDVLGYAHSTREVRHILHNGNALRSTVESAKMFAVVLDSWTFSALGEEQLPMCSRP